MLIFLQKLRCLSFPSSSTATNVLGAEPKKLIKIQIRNFSTECAWDRLYVYDGESFSGTLLAVYSGDAISPRPVYAQTGSVSRPVFPSYQRQNLTSLG